ncbi:MAG: GC-type dockerin domain-anchored protein, partial [Phycisphaerales bacterium JB064]
MHKHLIGIAALVGLAGSAMAQNVAIVAAASTSSTSLSFTEVERLLNESALFDSVTVINTVTTTPTLDELLAFDSVIVWTNNTPGDPATLGDNLADYVDMGGGVVVATFANSSTTTDRDIAGRWRGNPDYEVIVPRSGNQSGGASLGTILEPGHPIMAGVTTFFGGTSSFRPRVTDLNPGARSIAEWDDGRVLVAIGANEKRVDLGFYPPPSTSSSGFWDISTDGNLLLAQSLLFAAGGDECRADLDGDGSLTLFDFLAFQNLFDSGDLLADFDGDGSLTLFDFLAFQNEFDAGCE